MLLGLGGPGGGGRFADAWGPISMPISHPVRPSHLATKSVRDARPALHVNTRYTTCLQSVAVEHVVANLAWFLKG